MIYRPARQFGIQIAPLQWTQDDFRLPDLSPRHVFVTDSISWPSRYQLSSETGLPRLEGWEEQEEEEEEERDLSNWRSFMVK